MTATPSGLRSRPPAQRAGIVLGVLVVVLAAVGLVNRANGDRTTTTAPSASPTATSVPTAPDACGGTVALADVDAPPVTQTLGVTVIAGPRLQLIDASGGEPRASSALLAAGEAASSAVRTSSGVYAVSSACSTPHSVLLAGSTVTSVDSAANPVGVVAAGDRALRITTAGDDEAVDPLDGSTRVLLPDGFETAGVVGGLLVGRRLYVPTANDSGNGAGKAPAGPTDETPVQLVDPATGAAVQDLGTTSAPVLVSAAGVLWTGAGCLGAAGSCELHWWDAATATTRTDTCPVTDAGEFTRVQAISADGHTVALGVPVDPDHGVPPEGSIRTRLVALDTTTCSRDVVAGLGLTTSVPATVSFDPGGTLLLVGVPVDGGYDVLAWRVGWAKVQRLATLPGIAAHPSPLLISAG